MAMAVNPGNTDQESLTRATQYCHLNPPISYVKILLGILIYAFFVEDSFPQWSIQNGIFSGIRLPNNWKAKNIPVVLVGCSVNQLVEIQIQLSNSSISLMMSRVYYGNIKSLQLFSLAIIVEHRLRPYVCVIV